MPGCYQYLGQYFQSGSERIVTTRSHLVNPSKFTIAPFVEVLILLSSVSVGYAGIILLFHHLNLRGNAFNRFHMLDSDTNTAYGVSFYANPFTRADALFASATLISGLSAFEVC